MQEVVFHDLQPASDFYRYRDSGFDFDTLLLHPLGDEFLTAS